MSYKKGNLRTYDIRGSNPKGIEQFEKSQKLYGGSYDKKGGSWKIKTDTGVFLEKPSKQPHIQKMKERIVGDGGYAEFQPDAYLEDEVPLSIAESITLKGRLFGNKNIQTLDMEKHDCHGNVRQLVKEKPYLIPIRGFKKTGGSWSRWVYHSWAYDPKKKRVIETIRLPKKAEKYFGVPFSEFE